MTEVREAARSNHRTETTEQETPAMTTDRITAETEAALIERAKDGDESAFETILRAHKGFLHAAARRASVFGTHGPEDLAQVGAVALWQRLRSWSPEHGARLSTYARHWVTTAMWEEVAEALGTSEPSLRRVAKAVRLCPDDMAAARDFATSPERGSQRMTGATFDAIQDAIQSFTHGEDGTFVEQEQTTAPSADRYGDLKDVFAAVEGLSDRERRIVALYYGTAPDAPKAGLTDAQIAEELDITENGANKARLRALAKVRKSLHI